MVVAPAPPTVSASPVPVMPPVSVSVLASELIRLSLPSVIAPDTVLLVAVLRRAPVFEMPVPFRVMASATVIAPDMLSAAPLATVVPPAAVPRAVELLIAITPALIVVAPV